ncbi:MAG: type II secretion system F family protein [Phycisphaerae bacterium]
MAGLIGIAILVIVSVALISYSFINSKVQHRELVTRRLRDMNETGTRKQKSSSEDSTRKWFREKAAPLLAKPVGTKSATDQSTLKIKLANAGFRKENAGTIFLASKTICGGGLLVLALVLCLSAGLSAQKVFGFTVFAGGLGFLLPDLWLRLAASSRGEKICHGLPDCLDLMVVSVEAGLGLDAALMRVSQEMGKVHAELAEEFILVNMETQMGLTRAEALTNLAIRTGIQELKSLSAILIQAEKFGTSIATALRNHAESLRTKRRQQAEERAAKTAVKLIIPLILFIFPAIFVVLAGPAVLKLMQVFSSGILISG